MFSKLSGNFIPKIPTTAGDCTIKRITFNFSNSSCVTFIVVRPARHRIPL